MSVEVLPLGKEQDSHYWKESHPTLNKWLHSPVGYVQVDRCWPARPTLLAHRTSQELAKMSVGAAALCAWQVAPSCLTAGRTSASGGVGWVGRGYCVPGCPLPSCCAQPRNTNHACSF